MTGRAGSGARAAAVAIAALLCTATASQAAPTWREAPLPAAAQSWTLMDVAMDRHGHGWVSGRQGVRALVARETAGAWRRSYLARTSLGSTQLSAVTTTAGGTQAFAVGAFASAEGGDRTLVVHWTGRRWERMGSRDRVGDTDLYGVAARGPNDVWAVGSSSPDGFLTTRTVIEHWDGEHWKLVRSPSPDDFQNELTHVAAGRDGSLFATGHTSTGTLLVHRAHGRWHTIAVPTPAGFTTAFLEGLAVRTRSDVWLAGYGQRASDGASRPLVAHWNGTAWRVRRPPNVGPQSYLGDVAVSGGRVIAVGTTFSESDSAGIVEEWDGHAWHVASSSATTGLAAVAARRGRALAVGQSPTGGAVVEERVP